MLSERCRRRVAASWSVLPRSDFVYVDDVAERLRGVTNDTFSLIIEFN